MYEIDPVILELRADVDSYIGRLEATTRRVDDLLDRQSLAAARSERRMNASFQKIGGGLVGLAALAATVFTGRELIQLVDASKKVEAQLRLATKESGSFSLAQEDVRRIAISTRSELEATAQLYGNFSRNSKELGISQEQAARATETVSKTFKISGATAVEASQGTRQLVQALQSGTLRGDEFNTIMESSPRLARLFADALGVPVGELRKLAEQGKLTSAELTRALTNQEFTKGIDDEFKQLPATFDEAMENIKTSATIVFGAFDRGGEFSNSITSFMIEGADGFSDLERSAESFGRTVRAELEGVAAAFGPVIAEARNLLQVLGADIDLEKAFSFGQDFKDIDAFTGWWANQGIGGGLITGNNDWLGNPTAKGKGVPKGQRKGTDFYGRYLKGKQQERERQTAKMQGGFAGRWLDRYNEMVVPLAPPAPRAGGGSTGGGGSKAKGPSAETLAKRAEAERVKAIRDDAAKQRELNAMNNDLLAARQALVTAAGDVAQLEIDRIENDRVQQQRDIDADVQLGDLGESEAAERRKLVDAIAMARKQRVLLNEGEAKAAMELTAARDDRETTELEAQLITNRKERARVEQEILRMSYEEEKAKLELAIANGEILDAAKARANLDKRYAAQQELAKRSDAGPLDNYMRDITEEAENLGDAYEGIAVNGLQRMNSEFGKMVTNSLKLHGIFGDLISDLIEMAFRQAVLGTLGKALGAALGGIGGGAGGGGDVINLGNISGYSFGRAGGGRVAPGQWYNVNEAASPGRVEGFMSMDGGKIVPLGQMNSIAEKSGANGGSGEATIRLELTGDLDARIERKSAGVAIEVVRNATPAIVNASANEAISRSSRPTL